MCALQEQSYYLTDNVLCSRTVCQLFTGFKIVSIRGCELSLFLSCLFVMLVKPSRIHFSLNAAVGNLQEEKVGNHCYNLNFV